MRVDALERWLGGLAESTRRGNLPLLQGFLEFSRVDADEAIGWQTAHPGDYRFVDLAYEWIEKNGNLSVSTMETRMGVVRGFFVANRAGLPQDKHRFHSDKEPVVGELSVEEFRRILLSCNKTYRAAFLSYFPC